MTDNDHREPQSCQTPVATLSGASHELTIEKLSIALSLWHGSSVPNWVPSQSGPPDGCSCCQSRLDLRAPICAITSRSCRSRQLDRTMI